jgi:hypothetical protein
VATIQPIDRAALPGGVTSDGGRALQEAIEYLKLALRQDQALKITPDPYERTSSVVQQYRKAAKALGIEISMRHLGLRAFHNHAGEQREEACEIYLVITKAKTAPAIPPKPHIVDTMAKPPIRTPHATYERSAIVPGLETSR